jgi:hypothetical protein
MGNAEGSTLNAERYWPKRKAQDTRHKVQGASRMFEAVFRVLR